MNKWIKIILNIIIFIVCIALICIGQKNIGPAGLGTMIVGLGGLLFLMYSYNKKYT
ncbi:MAG: hypothetical protein IKM28_02635 [Lachnospiraceae bacterium]|nr:hypothetical protein [Lachnospiraceae bacterium]